MRMSWGPQKLKSLTTLSNCNIMLAMSLGFISVQRINLIFIGVARVEYKSRKGIRER